MPSLSLNIAACVPFSGRKAHVRFRSEAWSPAAARATSLTTLLTTLVSLDPLYLDFDMSESDFLTFPRERARIKGPLANKILIGLSDEDSLAREGTLDFIDNALDRSSGTIHARGTVPKPDLFPGARPFRPAARRQRAAGAGLSAAGRSRRARPVGAAGDDRRPPMPP
jgi:multidrug efflux pump subunit AcrA (membrane-fusion protein)